MTAKEMFEKSGYEEDRIYIDGYINQIVYRSKNKYGQTYKEIIFQYDGEVIDFFGYESIDVNELQAINKQIEELGWLDKKGKE